MDILIFLTVFAAMGVVTIASRWCGYEKGYEAGYWAGYQAGQGFHWLNHSPEAVKQDEDCPVCHFWRAQGESECVGCRKIFS